MELDLEVLAVMEAFQKWGCDRRPMLHQWHVPQISAKSES